MDPGMWERVDRERSVSDRKKLQKQIIDEFSKRGIHAEALSIGDRVKLTNRYGLIVK